MKILVSGIAGDIGFGVGRILQNLEFVSHVLGIDIHSNHPGSLLFDKCDVAPSAINSKYIPWLYDYLEKNEVDIFIPTSEAEIGLISSINKNDFSSTKILISNEFMIDRCLSKNRCLNYLDSINIKIPKHGIVGKDLPSLFPIIIKPNSGRGSQNLMKIKSNIEFKSFLDTRPENFVWQQYLYPDDQEYTCALFRNNKIDLRSLVIKRELSDGFTSKGEIVEDYEIENYIKKIAESFDLEGVMNIQLRLTDTGPVMFEINPRLSSTLVFRDLLGFKDLEWWILSSIGKPIPSYIKPKKGTLFYRGTSELIIEQ